MVRIKIYLLFFLALISSRLINAQVYVDWNSHWSYYKGLSEPSSPYGLWRESGFNDSAWSLGYAPFWYGDGVGGTLLSDMAGNYSTLYLRKEFQFSGADSIDELRFTVDYDDGFVLWINGQLIRAENVPSSYAFDQFAPANHESGEWLNFSILKNDLQLVNGVNIIAVQGFNVSNTSSDFHLDVKVEGARLLPEAEPVTCNKQSGFYTYLFTAEINSLVSGETIKYTLDGSDPRYSSTALTRVSPTKVVIDPNSTVGGRGKSGGAVLRASKFKEGFNPSKPITRNYIFLSQVKIQTIPGGAWPNYNVNNQAIDYPMDPNIVNDSRFKDHVDAALLDLPTIAISTDLEHLFDAQTGIYVNAKYHGRNWERPANIELINPDGSPGFNIDAGLRIRGGWSRHPEFAKHAFRVFFRSEYGAGKLDFPLFEEEGVTKFDKIDFRTSQNYSWSKGGGEGVHNTMNRDVFSRDTHREMNQPYTRSRYYHLYLNGMYWGIYQTQERAEASFAESYFGGNKDDYDVIKVDIGENWNLYEIEATDGNTDAWQEVWNISQAGFSSNADYFKLLGRNPAGEEDTSMNVWVDIDNLIDYMLVIFYTGNFDSPVSKFSNNYNPNNFFAIYNRTRKREGFKFILHDAEHTLLADPVGPGAGLNENRVNITMNVGYFAKFHPQWLHYKLTENQEYRMRFADRVYLHFFQNGVFNPDSCIARFKNTSDLLDKAIIAESARWGDIGAWPARNRVDDWIPAVERVVNNYFPYRTEIVLNQLEAENLYVSLAPPRFSKNGKEISGSSLIISEDYEMFMENPNGTGTILYTTDGKDPRAVGGSISASAMDAGSTESLLVHPGTRLKARVKSGSSWSAIHEIYFQEAALFNNLKVTELNYNPPDVLYYPGRDFEFIELKNIGNSSLDLSGLTFTEGIGFTFPAGTILAPQSFVVIASSSQMFEYYFGYLPDFEFTGNLANEGEKVVLKTASGHLVLSFIYSNEFPWPTEADGKGYSLVSVNKNPGGDPNEAEYWTVSSLEYGSPMVDDPHSFTGIPDSRLGDGKEVKLFPNPSNSSVYITFSLEKPECIDIGIYDLGGKIVEGILKENLPAGKHTQFVDVGNLGIEPGVYIIRLKTEGLIYTMKLIYY